MKTAVYSTHKFEKEFLKEANADKHELKYLDVQLNESTAYLAKGNVAVSIFVNDDASSKVLEKLNEDGIKFLVLRSAGFNNVDIPLAHKLGMRIARVPAYSPYAVAEHAVSLMMALNRKLIKANSRVHDSNFSLDGLTGFDMHGKTVGIIGSGQIGSIAAKILNGFGCRILVVDQFENKELVEKYNVEYTDSDTIYSQSDIISSE